MSELVAALPRASPGYLYLCWQASRNGRELPDGPLCPGPNGTPYLPYGTASGRFAAICGHLAIPGVHTHSLRHQFASEALGTHPRELANISQVLGHDSVQTTLRFYIHPSVNAEQRISTMMNARWTTPPHPAA